MIYKGERIHLKGVREAFIFTVINSVLLIMPKVAPSLLSQIMADNILTGLNPEWFTPALWFFGFLVVFEFINRVCEAIYAWKLKLKVSLNASSELFWHILRLPMSYFQNHFAGDLTSRVALGTSISNLLIVKLGTMVYNVILSVVYLILMIKYNLVLSVFALIHIALNIFILSRTKKTKKQESKQLHKELGNIQGITNSYMSSIDSIKAASAEVSYRQRWSAYFAKTQNASVEFSKGETYAHALPLFLESIATAMVLGIGAYYIIQGELTVGMLMAFQGFMSACLKPMNKLINSMLIWINVKTQIERMDEVMVEDCDVSPDLECSDKVEQGKLKGNVELRDVTFGYDRSLPPLIENFNMTLEPGKSVAFVGSSGCGKSTLAKLVSGLYKPWSGEVLFDGKRQDDIDRNVFVNSVAIIDQNIVMFNDSISANVKLWDESIEDFAMIFACHDAQIHNDIALRPDGYDSMIENNGSNFSGGQIQRLEIASALAKEPVIMIMDEGTSALDPITEMKVMQAIKDMGIALIVIAHRLSTIRDCDEIIVMDRGKVQERGTHDILINNGGLYSQLMKHN